MAERLTDVEKLNRIKSGLHCSNEEALSVLAYDKAVDRGEKTEYDLSPEKEKAAKKFAHTGTRKVPTVYNFSQRKRKPNATKGGLIAELAEFLEKQSGFDIQNLVIEKPERLISFAIGDNKFEVVLTQKRKK